ncbi:MAG: hypothetical protein ACOCRK_09775 [bacterium]
MKQYQLSILVGIYHHARSNIENGKHYPQKKTRQAIETVLGCKVVWIKTRLQGVKYFKSGPDDSAIYAYLISIQFLI